MSAPTNPRAFERCLIASNEPQPSVADSAQRHVMSLPIRQQIAIVQAIVEGEFWQEICTVDSLAIDKALTNFATDMEEAAHDEDVRMHGPVERTGSGYWL